MTRRAIFVSMVTLAFSAGIGCSTSPGRPGQDSAVIPPNRIMDFKTLYGQNCAGCHGPSGKGGAAIALDDPVFLAIADDNVIRHAAANGVPGTPMPAFGQSAGGMLTDQQIDAIAAGIRSWAKPDSFRDVTLPAYGAQTPGDPTRGADRYHTYCSSCHGADGRGGSKASSIVDGSYLALVSDQELRTVVIAGRPELGAPDWRGDLAGHSMSAQDISDIVAWLSGQRPRFAGQPYSMTSMNQANGGSR